MITDRMKTILYLAAVVGVFSLAIVCYPYVQSNASVPAPEDVTTIENTSAYKKKNRPAVAFDHESHMRSNECLDCHHDYQGGENVLDESDLDEDGSALCTACHDRKASIDLKAAYHRQCMGCHRTVNKEESAALPITCQECHPRRSPEL